ncbi:MAG: hypothetical protein LUH47_05385, partial [Clostridiales bacterium]|nr:hypothetical protein [Clostridiales bacterium]
MEIAELGNGVKVFMYKEDKFNSCGVAVLLRRRLTRDEVTANALLVNVMGLGCRKYRSPAELNRAADRLFGGCFDCVNMKKGNWQLSEFYAETVNKGDNVKNTLKFLGDIILKPLTVGKGFKPEYVEREKQALKSIIYSVKDNKKDYAKRKLEEKMFIDEGYGIYGDGYIEDVDKITSEGLYRHYTDIIGTSAVDTIAVGNFDKNEFLTAAEGLNLKGQRTETDNKKEFKKKDTSY